jgi:hypothetical protein
MKYPNLGFHLESSERDPSWHACNQKRKNRAIHVAQLPPLQGEWEDGPKKGQFTYKYQRQREVH